MQRNKLYDLRWKEELNNGNRTRISHMLELSMTATFK